MAKKARHLDATEVVQYVHGLVHREVTFAMQEIEKKARKSPEFAHIESRVSELEEWRLSVLSAETLGIPRVAAERESVLPVRYYIDSDNQVVADEVEQALELTLDEIGFQVAATYPIIRGSFFRKFFFASRRNLTPEQVAESIAKIERSVGVRTLDLPQSQVDLNRADGVAKLLASLEHANSALVQIGSILIVKVDGTPIVLNLTPHELSELERMPTVFRSPSDALSMIQKLRHQDKTSSSISRINAE